MQFQDFCQNYCKVDILVPQRMVGYEPRAAILSPYFKKLPLNHAKTEEKRVKRWRVTDPGDAVGTSRSIIPKVIRP